jgi:hypothetical protein
MSKLIFTILRDSKGNNLSLDNINLEGSEALEIFISNLNRYIKLKTNQDNTDIKISLTPGSINTELVYDDARTDVENDIKSVLEGTAQSNELINIFKTIQDKIKANGLHYRVESYNNSSNEREDITDIFKGKAFKRYRAQYDKKYKVSFVKGDMYNIGGLNNANLHINSNNEVYKIECSKEQAKLIQNNLYSRVFLSVIETYKNNIKDKSDLIDFYSDENTYLEYSTFYNDVLNNGIDGHDTIYFKLKEFIKDDNFKGVNKIINLFNVYEIDRGFVRTILSTLKPYKENPLISAKFEKMAYNLKSSSLIKRI